MIQTVKYARENNIPYFGICLGMQIMVIEYARSILGLENASSTEFSQDTQYPVISLLEEQLDTKLYWGTMKLGNSDTKLKHNTKIFDIYKEEVITERHRHRYEFSNKYREVFENAGFVISGYTLDDALVESVEWPKHKWGIGVQYHPEFKSKPFSPHPLFVQFVKASKENAK